MTRWAGVPEDRVQAVLFAEREAKAAKSLADTELRWYELQTQLEDSLA
ncbi:hypothetical protein NA78x_001377 [Anatilimnocola sp. NA78]